MERKEVDATEVIGDILMVVKLVKLLSVAAISGSRAREISRAWITNFPSDTILDFRCSVTGRACSAGSSELSVWGKRSQAAAG